MADKLTSDPFLIFALRGLPPDDLVERLRQRRSAAGGNRATGGGAPIYTQHLPGVADRQSPPLESVMSSFWSLGSALEDLDLPIDSPEVPHPLLRRMGAPPFAGAKFPLVGLLATCYEVVTNAMVADEGGGAAGAVENGDAETDPDAATDDGE